MLGTPVVVNPFESLEAAKLDWPFPQLFKIGNKVFLGARHYIYKVEANWTLTQLTAWCHSDVQWSAAGFHTFNVFTNGAVVILNDVNVDQYRFASTSEFPACKTLCDFYGQLVVGNTVMGQNWIAWSSIGDASFEIGRTNLAGYMPMPWSGAVLVVAVLGKDVVVYGEDGISLLKPSSVTAAEPVATFGRQDISSFGLASQGAVGIARHTHVFIDERGYLRVITSEGTQRHGYQEFFQPMLGGDIRITYDELEGEFYISDGSTSYVYSPAGLGSSMLALTGMFALDGGIIGCWKEVGEEKFLAISDNVDFDIRGKKFISAVALDYETDGTMTVAVDWRNSPKSSFRRGPYVPVNKEGYAYPKVTGTDVRFVFRVTDATYVELRGATVRWKLVDKRAIRGAYGSSKATAE